MRPMISRQEFLRGAVGALAAGAMFGTGRAGADPASGWTGLSSSIGGKVLLPMAKAQARKQIPKDQARMKELLESH